MAALPVDGVSSISDTPPADGLEYLRRVRYEARNLPEVLIAHNLPAHRPESYTLSGAAQPAASDPQLNSSPTPSTSSHAHNVRRWVAIPPPLPACPEHRAPTDAWRADVLTTFVSLRSSLRRRSTQPQAHNRARKQSSAPLGRRKTAWLAIFSDATRRPQLSDLLIQDQLSVVRIFEWCVQMTTTQPALREHHARWCYALMVALDLPLDPDTSADVAALLRFCSKRIADDSTEVSTTEVASLSLLITLTKDFFRQR
mmetsp:Transcript_19097/g.48548  ORF Transcript_19097/g.48548 Transcript_19097/m.48548 type:complete len:256 (-) Transcript_19097:21-788(-)